MGAPIFKWRETIRRHDVKVFSSNFALYGDMSKQGDEYSETVCAGDGGL